MPSLTFPHEIDTVSGLTINLDEYTWITAEQPPGTLLWDVRLHKRGQRRVLASGLLREEAYAVAAGYATDLAVAA